MNSVQEQASSIYRFGPWRFDAGTGDLAGDGPGIRLEPQVARLLAFFLTHQGRLVSRDDLIEEVWNGRTVSDDAIARCVSILRRRLTPDDRHAYIETVVRRGFISHFPPPQSGAEPVRARPAAEGPHANVERRLQRQRPFSIRRPYALAALLLTVVFLFAYQRMFDSDGFTPPAVRAQPPMLAVLPFTSNDRAGEGELFARGIHDDLLTRLAQLESLRVISRTSVLDYGDGARNLREIGRQLGAEAILEGGVQRMDDRIRINVQLIDARTDVHLWADQYDRELTPANIFDVQAEIAREVAFSLHARLTRREADRLSSIPTQNMAAYRAYQEAIQLRRSTSIRDPDYIAALERAVAHDPGFVRAWAELAGSLAYDNINERAPESIRRLERILERIRKLAPHSSEHLIAQGYYAYYIVKDYERAHELVRQAQALRPSDVELLELRSWIERRLGDQEGVMETLARARLLDPRNELLARRAVTGLLTLHRYDKAMEELDRAGFTTFELAVMRNLLQMREHSDPASLLHGLLALEREYDTESIPLDRWEAQIAARDFGGAGAFLEAFDAAGRSAEEWSHLSTPDAELAHVITEWMRGSSAQASERRTRLRTRLSRAGEAGFEGFSPNFHLAMALVTAADGDREETERRIRTWFRQAPKDQAELINQRHWACRALGMAAAEPAALDCLRAALAEPSLVMPFIEPHLPYYDPIRADPGFVDFLARVRLHASAS